MKDQVGTFKSNSKVLGGGLDFWFTKKVGTWQDVNVKLNVKELLGFKFHRDWTSNRI